VALGFGIAAGSRMEPDEIAGVSHFIEHLIFKGSDRYSSWDIARIFDEMGGRAQRRHVQGADRRARALPGRRSG
jgi:predicted Zn-dependent peptidase